MPTDETADPTIPRYGWRLPTGGTGLHGMAAEPEPGDDPEKVSRFVLYSGHEVRYNPLWQQGGDVIATDEIQLERYHANPIVLLEHSPDLVIGTGAAKIVPAAGGVKALRWDVTWDLDPRNPTAILVAGQHARRIRRAVSLGFMPGKDSVSRADLPKGHKFRIETESKWSAGNYWRHAEMYEGSSVSIPKDPNALQLQSWALASPDGPVGGIERYTAEVLPAKLREMVLDAVRNDPGIRTSIAAMVLGAIPNGAGKADGWSLDDWPSR